jgi:hypothetical protein
MQKRFLVLLFVLIGICAASALIAWVYLSQRLYLPQESDQDLINTLFDTDFPGYAQIEIIDSQGEGIRRIPRQMLIEVQMQVYPEMVTCPAEIYFDVGDPMALNAQWQSLECIGQHRLMELARVAMASGMRENACHASTITNLLAHWVNTGVIQPSNVRSPELRQLISQLAGDDQYMQAIPVLDGGLFSTQQAVAHNRIKEDNAPGYPAYVLRCDGTLDVYLLRSRSDVYQAANMQAGDDLLPEPLHQESMPAFLLTAIPAAKEREKAIAEGTLIPTKECVGWACSASGKIYGGAVEAENLLSGAQITITHASYCSYAGWEPTTLTNAGGEFRFDLDVYDTDRLDIEISAEGYQPQFVQIDGQDCLNCSCFPMQFVLEPVSQ